MTFFFGKAAPCRSKLLVSARVYSRPIGPLGFCQPHKGVCILDPLLAGGVWKSLCPLQIQMLRTSFLDLSKVMFYGLGSKGIYHCYSLLCKGEYFLEPLTNWDDPYSFSSSM